MLNYETLLSSYDDKLTLMQWLKKVEKALAGASASSFEVIKTGNATLRFRINFEDGTYLESGDIVLQQGESVSSGEIRNGHLYLTLTNGQELDCGELFNGEVPSLEVRSLEVTGGLIVGDDANAAIGGDLVVHGLTEVQNLLAYGHVETETLTTAGNQINAEKPVVEVMSGYNFRDSSSNVSASFASACKNGNKLTFAISGTLTTGETLPSSGVYTLGAFGIPNAIGQKLIPTQGTSRLAVTTLACIRSIFDAPVTATATVLKDSNTYITIQVLTNRLSVSTTYEFRFEITFLLSENLAA